MTIIEYGYDCETVPEGVRVQEREINGRVKALTISLGPG
jgi:hypothetical protein